jgi:tetratricopeptide (TPR) repeat protein
VKLPKSMQRLAVEVEGWLELGCPDRALAKMEPLLDAPGARPVALQFKVRAMVDLGRYGDALDALDEASYFEHDAVWRDVTEAWCRKRLGDLPAAIACMERLLRRNPRSAIGHFNLGCYLALSGDLEQALDEVSLACGMDETFRKLARDEADLGALHEDPRFRALLPGSESEED